MNEERPLHDSGLARGGFLGRLRRFLTPRGRARGATTVEHALIMSLALGGAVGFKELGNKLHSQLEREGEHIEGKGMPKNGNLASLAASFETPSTELGCPGPACGLPALSLVPDGAGVPNASTVADPVSASSGSTGANGSPGSPGPAIAVPGRRPFTLEERERKQQCEEELDKSLQKYAEVKKSSKKKQGIRVSRAEAIQRLCTEMICECGADKSDKECLAQWSCIYERVARQTTSDYFGASRAAGADECADPATRSANNQSLRRECADKQIKEWACTKPPAVGPVAHGPALTTTTIPPSTIRTTPTNRDNAVSEAAGMDAARLFCNANFAGYQCYEESGPNEFDLVCVQGNNVVIVEAKGGTSPLGKRRGLDDDYVQQGTLGYAAVEATVISNHALGAMVENAIENQTVRYFSVRQPFDSTGTPTTPKVTEFDLYNPDSACKDCKCN